MPGWNPQTGREIRDFSLSPREMLGLPMTSRTTDPVTGEATQEVYQATGPDGVTYTITVDYTYTSGYVTTATVLYQGGGPDVTHTWTYTRDANGEITAETRS